MAGSNTIGLGLGVVILIVLWTITAFLWVLLSRSQTAIRSAITCLSLVLSISMFVIPSDEGSKTSSDSHKKTYELYDYVFIWRALLIILLFISIAAAAGIYLGQFWSVKVHASHPVPKKRSQQSSYLVDFDFKY